MVQDWISDSFNSIKTFDSSAMRNADPTVALGRFLGFLVAHKAPSLQRPIEY
jgi:hypothetical protein